ncbi:isocitrate lyase/phosphoenolpyruvate mutase family protein [Cellulomonas sp. NPDC089187]|uniref:isocitrate lyase/PEP mutase family protein n=1 Tax=Cellulomonas sp. NPDC089187 TaxID=3154970 RepID=UPI003435CFDD
MTASTFRDLHRPGHPLRLVNVWDAGSAIAAERAGAAALGTTSAGMAWALGLPDGDHLTSTLLLPVVRRICAAVRIPVSVDLESGYGRTLGAVRHLVRRVAEAGAAGINLEDGTRSPAQFAARIAAATSAAPSIFVNARTDVVLRGLVPAKDQLAELRRRAALYRDAGADGLFVPGLLDPDLVAELTATVDLPVNVMAGPGAPSVARLAEAGVARVSLGSSTAQAALSLVRRSTEDLVTAGVYDAATDIDDYRTVDGLFSR